MEKKTKIFAVIIIAIMLSAFMSIFSTAAADGTIKNYGNITLSGGFQAGHFDDWWDLTAGDMMLSFTYDANGLVDDFGGSAHAWAEIGVRSACYGDFNPTWQVEGSGVWLATDYDWTVNTFDPDPPGNPVLDLDDKLILQKAGGQGEGDYNLPSTPPNPWANHRVWWDRDGVDPWQNDETANTGGIYDIIISLHATSATSGTAYMNIRGLDQGFETDGNWNTIELTPAGMTFTGDMAHLQIFYGLYGYGATHSVSFEDITVEGYLGEPPLAPCFEQSIDIKPGSYPNTINQKSKGNVPVAILTTDDFDASMVDASTVKFLGGSPCKKEKLEDIDSDGDIDMLLHFKTQDLTFSLPWVENDWAFLTGYTIGGEFIWGKDTIKLVGPLFEIVEQLIERFPILEPLLQPF
jgi:hypothetical protein